MAALTDADTKPADTGTDERPSLAHYYPESIDFPQPPFPWTSLCGRILAPENGKITRSTFGTERCVVCVEMKRSTH